MKKGVKKAKSTKTRTKKFRPYIYVTVVYSGYDEAKDEQFIKMAKQHGGEESGSGFGFGKRDIGIIFYDLESAGKFASEVLEAGAEDVDGVCELYYK
jgi:hypothetical protein